MRLTREDLGMDVGILVTIRSLLPNLAPVAIKVDGTSIVQG